MGNIWMLFLKKWDKYKAYLATNKGPVAITSNDHLY